MEYILVLKNGLGNKIFILINFLHLYKNVTFHIIDKTSHHQEKIPSEKLFYLFPKLKEIKNISFIRWKEYDELKKKLPEFEIPFDIYYSIEGFKPSIKKYFKSNEIYDTLKEKYDFKKGIFVHFRLGDKFVLNLIELKKGKKPKYVLMKPEYYEHHISELRMNDEPVYIFSDSTKIAKCLLGADYEYIDEGVNETFYCFQNARRVIISESTLSISAVLLGSKKKDFIFPDFLYMPKEDGTYKLIKSPYFKDGETQKKYLLQTLEEYKDIVKRCKVKF
jgi:hypothetical protein